MSRKTFTRLVTLFQPSGREVNVNLVLGKKPVREEQKLKTLTKYVRQYPSGWKKRLELADLLYGMGKWQDAIGCADGACQPSHTRMPPLVLQERQ